MCLVALLKSFLLYVTIADTDSPGLQYVLEQTEKGKGRKEGRSVEGPSGSHLVYKLRMEKRASKGIKKGEVKMSLRLYAGRDGQRKKRWTVLRNTKGTR